MLLEIAVFDASSAIAAAKAGADRIELCENATEGGTTVSYGTLKYVLSHTDIPVFPIIRPRGGDFLYTDAEYEIMKSDIKMCKQAGCEGVVLGLLLSNGNIDTERTRQLVELAAPMEVTFHRAFDRCADPFGAMEDIIRSGCHRILSSGLFPTVNEGRELLRQLIQKAAGHIIIVPGSGVRSNNIKEILTYTGASEIHSSARILLPSTMLYINPEMREDLLQISVDTNEIGRMKQIIHEL